MRFSKFIFIAVFVLCPWSMAYGPAFAQESPSRLHLSLQDCLELALQNNAKLPIRDYAISAAEQRIREAKAGFWPVIDYSDKMAPAPKDALHAAKSFFEGDLTFWNSTHIGLGFPVYAFGQLETAQNLARKGVEVAKQEKVRDETTIHFEVQQLYHGILFSREIQSIMQDAVNKLENQLKKEEETKKHSPYDILKLKVFKADLEKRILEIKEKETEARLALKIQMGLPEGSTFELADSHLEPAQKTLKPLTEYLNTSESDRAESQLVDLGVSLKKLEYDMEKKKRLPRVGFGGFFEVARTTSDIRNLRLTDDFNDPFNFMRAGAGIEVKGVLDFHGSSAKVKRLESEYQKAVLERNLAKQGMQLEVETAYHDANRLQEAMILSEEKQKMARQMMFLSKANLDIGVGEEKDYTDALQLVLLTRGEYLKSVFDYNMALAKLDQKAGRRYEVSAQ